MKNEALCTDSLGNLFYLRDLLFLQMTRVSMKHSTPVRMRRNALSQSVSAAFPPKEEGSEHNKTPEGPPTMTAVPFRKTGATSTTARRSRRHQDAVTGGVNRLLNCSKGFTTPIQPFVRYTVSNVENASFR
jgi:hypothetical protein